jgi:hypothetical protein
MKVLLRWMEPIEVIPPKRRAKLTTWIFCFAVSAVVGLGIMEQSGPTIRTAVGGGIELPLPSQAWQYGLWLFVFVGGGWFGSWIVLYGGRAEVTMRTDGVVWLLGRAGARFYEYSKVQRCEFERGDEGSFWWLRVTMKPERPGDPAFVGAIGIPKHIDVNRVRDILKSSGVETTG